MLLTHRNSESKPFSMEEAESLVRRLTDRTSHRTRHDAALELSKNAKRILFTLTDAYNDLVRLDSENNRLDKDCAQQGKKIAMLRTVTHKLLAERKTKLEI